MPKGWLKAGVHQLHEMNWKEFHFYFQQNWKQSREWMYWVLKWLSWLHKSRWTYRVISKPIGDAAVCIVIGRFLRFSCWLQLESSKMQLESNRSDKKPVHVFENLRRLQTTRKMTLTNPKKLDPEVMHLFRAKQELSKWCTCPEFFKTYFFTTEDTYSLPLADVQVCSRFFCKSRVWHSETMLLWLNALERRVNVTVGWWQRESYWSWVTKREYRSVLKWSCHETDKRKSLRISITKRMLEKAEVWVAYQRGKSNNKDWKIQAEENRIEADADDDSPETGENVRVCRFQLLFIHRFMKQVILTEFENENTVSRKETNACLSPWCTRKKQSYRWTFVEWCTFQPNTCWGDLKQQLGVGTLGANFWFRLWAPLTQIMDPYLDLYPPSLSCLASHLIFFALCGLLA